jgi:coproporphyrinogen III oxidase-like Fe-S oxidoreductase
MGFDFQNDGEVEEVSEQADRQERRIFALRTQEGLDVSRWDSPQRGQVESTLDAFVAKDLLSKSGAIYRLTPRGFEVCDSILAEIV